MRAPVFPVGAAPQSQVIITMSFLQFSTPEAEGVSSKTLLQFINRLDSLEYLHGVTIFRHGRVILRGNWKPYDSSTPHHLFSLSKSFVSCAVGFAIQEGLLKLTDTLGKLFPEYAEDEQISAAARAVTVRDLLTMRGGQQQCHLGEFIFHEDVKPFARRFLEVPMFTQGGEAFVYNSGNTFMLSAIVQKLTGMKIAEYLQPRLFTPLGILPPQWDEAPEGICLGGWGLYLSLESLSRFTKLLSDNGRWNGKQILPPEYLKEATSFQSDNSCNKNRDWENGYGYQFWRCSHEGAWRGDGACGQYALIIPDYDLAITTLSGLSEMGRILLAVWEELLPGIAGDAPLPIVPADQQALAEKLASLELPRPQGAYSTPLADCKFTLAENTWAYETLECQFQASGGKCILTRAGKEYEIPFGYGRWERGHAPELFGKYSPIGGDIAATAAWENENTLLINIALLNHPSFARLKLEFDDDKITIQRTLNIWFLYGVDDLKNTVTGKRE